MGEKKIEGAMRGDYIKEGTRDVGQNGLLRDLFAGTLGYKALEEIKHANTLHISHANPPSKAANDLNSSMHLRRMARYLELG